MENEKEILKEIENGNEGIIWDLIKTKKIRATEICSDGNTLLHHAVLFGNESSIKALLDLGANPVIRNKDGKTPLELAKSIGGEIADGMSFQLDEHLRTEVVRTAFNPTFITRLVLGGANPLTRDLEGKTTMYLATKSSNKRECLKNALELQYFDTIVDPDKKKDINLEDIERNKRETLASKIRKNLSRKMSGVFAKMSTISIVNPFKRKSSNIER